MIGCQPHWNRIVVALTTLPSFKVSSTVNQPATEPIVDFVSQLKMNWGELKRNVLFPFAPIVGEYSKTQAERSMTQGDSIASGRACLHQLQSAQSPIGFPLRPEAPLEGTAEPWLTVPEKVGAVIVPAVLNGDKKPTNVHGTEIGPAVFEGTLSRPSDSTVVTNSCKSRRS